MKCILSCAVFSVVVLTGLAATADVQVPPDREAEQVVAPVAIRRGPIRGADRSVQAKIVIPRHLVQGAGAAAAPASPAPESDQMGASPSSTGTWIAGIALSLAAASLVFVVRGKRSSRDVALALLVGSILLGGWSAAHADLAPARPAGPQIVIELVDEGESVTLLLAR